MATAIEQMEAKQAELADLLTKGLDTAEDRERMSGLIGTIETLKGAVGAQDVARLMKGIVGDSKEEKQRVLTLADEIFGHADWGYIQGGKAGKIESKMLPYAALRLKAPNGLVSTARPGHGQELLVTDNLGVTVTPQFRLPTVIDMVTRGTSNAEIVTWIENSFVNNADVVDEATEAGGWGANGGLKPDSENMYVQRQATVKWLAHAKHVTRQALANRGQLIGTIETELLDGLQERAERLIFDDPDWGIMNTSGVQVQPFDANVRRTLLQARRLVLSARGTPQGVLMNPEDAVEVYDEQDAGGWYYSGGPVDAPIARRWGMQIVESELVPVGTAVVGDFSGIHLDMVVQPETAQTNSHLDFFMRNIESVRAEMACILRNEYPSRLVLTSLS